MRVFNQLLGRKARRGGAFKQKGGCDARTFGHKARALLLITAAVVVGVAGAAETTSVIFDIEDAKNGIDHGTKLDSYVVESSDLFAEEEPYTIPAPGDDFFANFYAADGNVTLCAVGGNTQAAVRLHWVDANGADTNRDIGRVWDGLYITYALTGDAPLYLLISSMQFGRNDYPDGYPLTDWNEYKTEMTIGSEERRNFKFSDFRQDRRGTNCAWGKCVELGTVLQKSHGFDFKLMGATGTSELTVKKVELYRTDVYTLTFDANGGDLEQTTLGIGASGIVEYWPVPTMDGHTFDGWYTAATGGNKIPETTTFNANRTIYAHWTEKSAIASPDRVIPNSLSANDVAAVAPVNRLTAELVAGPNPAAKSSGAVNFFRQGVRVSSASLSVYDASGNAVRRIAITDNAAVNAAVNAGKRLVGSWDLRDEKGRAVPDGTYLLRGTLKSKGGYSEKVSVVVGVR